MAKILTLGVFIMKNLKRYHSTTGMNDDGYYAVMEECPLGDYVKFDEAVEASSNSLQQLRAEIAALLRGLIPPDSEHFRTLSLDEFIAKLRQLSDG
jgi:hypothetical protein